MITIEELEDAKIKSKKALNNLKNVESSIGETTTIRLNPTTIVTVKNKERLNDYINYQNKK